MGEGTNFVLDGFSDGWVRVRLTHTLPIVLRLAGEIDDGGFIAVHPPNTGSIS